MVRTVSAKVWSGSSPATKVSEHRVWLTRPVATRTALSGRNTAAAIARPATTRSRAARVTLRIG